eukprot:582651-Karenia_brevis.AAC.1
MCRVGSQTPYRIARAIYMWQFQVLAAAGGSLRMEHVHGHGGQPWNELVDCLAKQSARGILSSS